MCRAEVASLEAARCYLEGNATLAAKWLAEFESRAKQFVSMSEQMEFEEAGPAAAGLTDADRFAFENFYFAGAGVLNRAFARTVESITDGDRERTTRCLRAFASLLDSYEAIAKLAPPPAM